MRSFTLGAALALGCTGPIEDTAEPADPRAATTDGGTWTVSYTPAPDPIPANQDFDLHLQVADADGPAAGTTVAVDAEMPEHGHGMNVTPTISGADGDFTAAGLLFHMTGEWRVTVAVTKGGATERAAFTVDCCED